MFTSPDTPVSRPARKRIQFTHQQKQEIRDFYHSHPQCTAKVLRMWFEAKHGLPLRPSTISTILRSADKSAVSNNAIRARLPKYPELENRLRQWVEQRMLTERDNNNFYITNEMLKTAAQEIWKSLPECKVKNSVEMGSRHPPSFSEGWIEKFKRRTNMPRLRRQSISKKTSESVSPAVITAPTVATKSSENDSTSISTTNTALVSVNPLKQQSQEHQQQHFQDCQPQQQFQHIQHLSPIIYASPPSNHIKLPSPHELLTNTSPPAFTTLPSPGSTPQPLSKSSLLNPSPDSVSSIHSILNPVEEEENGQEGSGSQLDTPRTPQVPHSDRMPSLIPDSVAKCHLNILKIYMEQTLNNHPFDTELQKSFASFEKAIESRTAAIMTGTATMESSSAVVAPTSSPSSHTACVN